VPRSKNEWSYTSISQYAFMAWCSVKAQGLYLYCTFTFIIIIIIIIVIVIIMHVISKMPVWHYNKIAIFIESGERILQMYAILGLRRPTLWT
jgi:hypothetical protein